MNWWWQHRPIIFWLKKKKIALEQIVNERWLLRESGSGIRDSMEQKFNEAGLQVQPYMELGSTESTKQAVMAGLGISVVPKQACRIEVKYDYMKILDVEGFPLIRDWYVVRPQDKVLSATAKAFVDFLQSIDINKLLAMSDTR